jgi:hypothetical protein
MYEGIETEIKRLGFDFAFEAQYDLERLNVNRDDPTGRVQVRDVKHVAPRDNVKRYAAQMEYAAFPPIVVTADGVTVDGNTRSAASLQRKSKFFPAYVLDVAYTSATPKQKHLLVALAATLNQQNGQPLDKSEQPAAVEALLAENWKSEEIIRAIGVTRGTVAAVRKEMQGKAKLERAGLKVEDMQPKTVRALGAEPAVDLNDAPYVALAKLATDAGLSMAEVKGLAKEAKATGSDADAVTLIERVRGESGERIRDRQLTGHGRPPRSRILRQHLGFIVNNADDITSLVETNPASMAETVEMLEQARSVIDQLLEAQRLKLAS